MSKYIHTYYHALADVAQSYNVFLTIYLILLTSHVMHHYVFVYIIHIVPGEEIIYSPTDKTVVKKGSFMFVTVFRKSSGENAIFKFYMNPIKYL